jgi:membrane-anchored protein YejM (alkaline phosphatase superfamily)
LPSISPHASAAARTFALLRGAMLFLAGLPYLLALGPEPFHYKAYFTGSWALWCAVLGALTALPVLLRPGRRAALAAAVAVAAAVDTLFLVDGFTYHAFRIHGGELFVRLALAGSSDPVVRLWSPGALAALVAAFAAANLGLAAAARRLADRGLAAPALGRRAAALLLAVFLAERAASAVIGYQGWHWPEGQTEAFPFYPQFSANRALEKWAVRPPADRHRRGRDYPAHALTSYASEPTAAGLRRPNVILILLESWRADSVTPEKMPKLARWAQGFTHYTRHYSGGDATRYGLFSLFYGLNATPIERLRAAKAGPYLFSYLGAAGYRRDVLTGEPLTILGSDETIFVDVLDRVYLPDYLRSSITDRFVVKRAKEIFAAQPAGAPFFTMAFFSSTHARYDFIPELVGIARKDAPKLAPRARYDASLRYVDGFIDELLRAAAARPDWNDTVVIVTGDHGEEFGEHGHTKHGWTLNQEESSVPLLVRFPGQATGSVVDRVTAHVDVVPTLLRFMGDARPVASYSDGRLLGEAGERLLFQQDWQRMGIFDGDTRIDFFHGSAGFFVPMRAFDDHEAPRDKQAFVVKHRDEIVELLRRNARFFN